MKRFITLAVALVASTCLYAGGFTEKQANELGDDCSAYTTTFQECIDYFNSRGFDVVYGFSFNEPTYGYDVYCGNIYDADGDYIGSINIIIDDERLSQISDEGEDFLLDTAYDFLEILYYNDGILDGDHEMVLTYADAWSED